MEGHAVTREAMRDAVAKVLPENRPGKGKLFVPSTEFYDRFSTNEGLTHNAKELYRWLGIKPTDLTVRYAHGHERSELTELIVPEHFNVYPYQAAAALCFEIVRTVLVRKKAFTTLSPEALTDATIAWGLGIIVVNGAYESRSVWELIYQYMQGYGHIERHVDLPGYRSSDYVQEVVNYATSYRLAAESWAPALSSAARSRFPLQGLRVVNSEPLLVQSHRRNSRRWWLHVALVGLLTALIAVTAMFTLSQRTQAPSPERLDAYHQVETLGQAYTACRKAAREEKKDLPPNDIFSEQQANATAERCKSIQNRYNYSVSEYNRILAKEL